MLYLVTENRLRRALASARELCKDRRMSARKPAATKTTTKRKTASAGALRSATSKTKSKTTINFSRSVRGK